MVMKDQHYEELLISSETNFATLYLSIPFIHHGLIAHTSMLGSLKTAPRLGSQYWRNEEVG